MVTKTATKPRAPSVSSPIFYTARRSTGLRIRSLHGMDAGQRSRVEIELFPCRNGEVSYKTPSRTVVACWPSRSSSDRIRGSARFGCHCGADYRRLRGSGW